MSRNDSVWKFMLRPAAALMLCLPVPAWAWGPEGHQVVARIAADALTPTARDRVGALLGGPAAPLMMLDANWADEVRAGRPDTAAWHFVNIELNSKGYDAARDCPRGDCVVAQIGNDTRVLAAPRANAAAKIEALRFLIHFLGDVHQPLHVADDHDRGGNDVILYRHGARTSLHRIWDTDVVAALGPDATQVAADIESHLTPAQRAAWSGGTPADWANDSFAVARQVYAGAPQGDVSQAYVRAQGNLVRTQLAKAGLRLAATLNRIFR